MTGLHLALLRPASGPVTAQIWPLRPTFAPELAVTGGATDIVLQCKQHVIDGFHKDQTYASRNKTGCGLDAKITFYEAISGHFGQFVLKH